MADTSMAVTPEQALYIQYLVQFRWKNNEDKNKVIRALINSGSEVNTMLLAYATNLGICAEKIDLGIQKIDRSHPATFGIIIANCSVKDKPGKIWFFWKICLLANIGLQVVLKMLFLTFNKADIRFVERKLVWKTYMAAEVLPMTKRVEIIDNIVFAIAALNKDNEIFVLHIAILAELITIPIYPSYYAQVNALMCNKTRIPTEYSDFFDIFSLDFAAKLLE